MTATLHTAKLALQNAEAAYHFYAFEADRQEAERWWARRCAWQQLVQELEAKEKPDGRGACNTRPLLNN